MKKLIEIMFWVSIVSFSIGIFVAMIFSLSTNSYAVFFEDANTPSVLRVYNRIGIDFILVKDSNTTPLDRYRIYDNYQMHLDTYLKTTIKDEYKRAIMEAQIKKKVGWYKEE